MSYPSFDQAVRDLQVRGFSYPEWKECWEESQKAYTEQAPFFCRSWLIEQNSLLNLKTEVMSFILRMADRLKNEELLARFAYHMYVVLFRKKHKLDKTAEKWPDLRAYLGREVGAFDAIVYISGIECIKAEFERRNISKEILAHTLGDLMEKFHRYHDVYDEWFVDCHGWETRLFQGEYVNIGRLQYHIIKNNRFCVFRHNLTRRTLAFLTTDESVRKDGLIDGTNQKYEDKPIHAANKKLNGTYEGFPVIPSGYVSTNKVRLDLSQWECVLQADDRVLNIHIPRRGRMPFVECKESLEKAMHFYARHYPEQPCRAFICGSWLLGNFLETMLPSDSNIIRFQREFYLSPLRSDEASTLFFVFGRKDVEGIVPKTTLEKMILSYLDNGKPMYNGAGFILFDDMDQYGTQAYRRAGEEVFCHKTKTWVKNHHGVTIL